MKETLIAQTIAHLCDLLGVPSVVQFCVWAMEVLPTPAQLVCWGGEERGYI